jgi:hypothetical protein
MEHSTPLSNYRQGKESIKNIEERFKSETHIKKIKLLT